MKEIKGSNTFCGPAVISAIADISTDEAERYLNAVRGTYGPIRGVYTKDLVAAFKKLGWKVEIIPGGSSVYATLYRVQKRPGMYVFMVPHHFVAIEVTAENVYICDNHTKEPMDVSNSARLSQAVAEILRVEKMTEAEIIEARRKPLNQIAKELNRILNLTRDSLIDLKDWTVDPINGDAGKVIALLEGSKVALSLALSAITIQNQQQEENSK